MSKNFELLHYEIRPGGGREHPAEGLPGEAKNPAQTAVKELTATEAAIREESLKLVQRLFLAPGEVTPKAVLFAGVDANSECSSLCAGVGRLLAESISGSVCLLEGNFRNRTLPQALGVVNYHGLADALRQEGPIRNFAKRIGPRDLWLVSSGSVTQDSSGQLNGDRMKERISELCSEFDFLLIDAPPMSAYADAMILGRLADGVVLVMEANKTRREVALRVTESLRASRIPVLGAVLNNRTFPIPAALYKRL
jgi:Mrp family chromosome partitioning ATPase